MDVCVVIKQRLEELGLEQRDLAAAAEVTRGYRVLHIAIVDREEIASGTWPDRHLREDGEISKSSGRQTVEAGGPPAQGRVEAQPKRNAQALV